MAGLYHLMATPGNPSRDCRARASPGALRSLPNLFDFDGGSCGRNLGPMAQASPFEPREKCDAVAGSPPHSFDDDVAVAL